MSFKLLAIRPMKGCNPKFLKNLEEERIYKFYNDYIFQDAKGNEITDFSQVIQVSNIKYESTTPINLYGDKINISAIVGKNGSGKSALVELFIASINQLSYSLLKDEEKKQLKTSASLKKIDNDENGKNIRCQIFYEFKNEYYYLCVNDIKFNLYKLSNRVEFKLDDFFYSMITNYSLYAFNSLTIGDWIDELFHKNDSYQIPIVINPKREHRENGLSGIIDINNEQFLLQQRLLVNILKPVINENFSLRKMGDNGIARKLEIKDIKEKQFKVVDTSPSQFITTQDTPYSTKIRLLRNDSYGILLNEQIIINPLEILEKTKDRFNIQEMRVPNQEQFDTYIIYKIINICHKYESYRKFSVDQDSNNKPVKCIKILDFLDYIEKYPSHILYKLKQTINYIKYYFDIWQAYDLSLPINIEDLSEKLNVFSTENNIPLIEILPPPVFETNILIESADKNDLIEFDNLSSGEQQLIHSISSVIYHLNNINSVKKDEIVKYQYVNIVFDEIELYFHPEFQKRFINNVLHQINNVKLDDILGINLLFITHSPFILSDIPRQNVLFLEVNDKGKSKPQDFTKMNTFGANIHDLLADSFFIGDGLIGDFAKEKINRTIQWLNELRVLKENITTNESSNFPTEAEKDYHKNLIELIDEPYMKYKLQEMYYEYFPNEYNIEKEKEQIKRRAIELGFKIE
ncbi:AAA family ATPase [Chryseobacterium viscerum]|uniref:ATPase AAA-type core domain-containing protein n=1 Tax=Chryseobacterium viscerum TaxID=1037377 RepID=A0A316WIB4_9FLAO|nr:AAA family ATPase [Chryseobacterium viscerum]PWN61147.1 hypothetical protein C1634_013890 [Chryseobacterium viscerum]